MASKRLRPIGAWREAASDPYFPFRTAERGRREKSAIQAIFGWIRAFAPAPGDHRLNSVIIRSNGIDLKVDRPVIVSVSKTSMTIRVME